MRLADIVVDRQRAVALIGELVGHGGLVTTARTYTQVLVDEAELDFAALCGER